MATALYSETITASPIVASIERKAREDANIRANAAALAKVCARIAESAAPADFLATHDGIVFLNSVHAMTGLDAVYDLARDCEHEMRADSDRRFAAGFLDAAE
ncbi:hypothetical protein FPZ24_08285 [Sphingomonas panacisoli]|uniref:Uncharacterized protein n=1 Tax=Sphingomonas panacisoli TaxID=1813879 RepID=A0A5B8LHG5_9SPHN|nr:hypothetical protein [Sphingomonas panacisoli]QDZ07481.1 hypothetical protein FPZ24_08285 [Sphingomonas panacisoli]